MSGSRGIWSLENCVVRAPDEPAAAESDPAAVDDSAQIDESKPAEGETKPAEGEKPVVPEPLTAEAITFPEDVVVDEDLRDELLGVLNNAELDSKGRAQALVDLHIKALKEASEKGSQAFMDMQTEWQDKAKAEYGQKLEPALSNIAKLIDKYGGDAEQTRELRDLFTMTGAGNNVRMIRFLDNIAQQLVVEGRPVPGAPSSAGRTIAQTLYPNQKEG